jgi:hypothetical protein
VDIWAIIAVPKEEVIEIHTFVPDVNLNDNDKKPE